VERVIHGGQPPYYRFASLAGERVIQAVLTRQGGVSQPPYDSLNVGRTVGDAPGAVGRNLDRALSTVGAAPERLVTAQQVHGDRVAIVRAADAGHTIPASDGLACDTVGLVLLLRFADCVPLLFYAPDREVVAIAHAGWRGTEQGIAARTVTLLRETFGCEPAALRVGIGPSIGPCCYEVGAEVYAPMGQRFGAASGVVAAPHAPGKARLDLWRANALQLEESGVRQIEAAGICTCCHRDEFFSHRGDLGRTGRFAALIGLRPATEE